MKKFLALATLVLGLASCQTEPEGFDVNVGGNQETLINVSLPEATRSADSGIANVDFNTYDLRYVLEVYDMAYTPASLVYRDVKSTDDTTTTFGVRLIPGRDYKFVVWADIVENGSTEDNFYVTANGLDEVALVDAKWTAMTETRDAYTGYVVIEKYNSASTIEMTLIRPFGKLRAVTTDIDAIEKLQNNALPKSVSVSYSVGAFSKFDALEATASEPIAKTFTYDLNNVYGESGNQLTLFADYLFGTETGTMQFQMDVTHENGNVTSNTFNTEIPIVRNQLTTLIGSILTDANNVKIEIDDEFAAEEIILVGEHTLTADLELDLPMVVKAGTTATLNLNGFNIINTNKTTEYGKGEGIVVYGDLTINGEGTIQGATRAVWARGDKGAKITINGGTFKGCEAGYTGGGNSVIYASSGNVIDIYGGTFEALAEDTESYANTLYPILNVADNNGMINVYGGLFKGQNPAAPGTEPKAWNDAHPNGFVADGYGVATRGEYFSVVPKIVADLDNVTNAITVELTEDLNVAANTTIHTERATAEITINGNGHSIISTAKSVDDFQWVGGTIPAMSTILSSANGSKVTVNDVTFEGTMSALMLGHYKNATYKNYNTELNNVNVIDTKVVSFSAGVSPAVCIYGTAVLNDCNIYGTTLSELDTDPMWPVYDLAAVNYSTTTLNNSKVGSFLFWNQAALIVNDGSVVDNLVLLGNMNNNNANNYIHINAGSEVKVIDLSKITDKKRVKITIEPGAKVGKIVANGVEYASLEAYLGTQVTTSEEFVEAFKNGDANITLANDIKLEERLEVAAGQNVNLDLNGKTITLEGTSVDPAFYTYKDSTLTITGNGTVEINDPSVSLIFPGGDVVIENGTFIRNIPAGTPANQVGAFFVGAKVSPWGSQKVTIKGGYFDGGYYNADAADIDEILAGTKTLTETADDIAKRGNSKDANKVRVAIKQNVQLLLNLSYNLFKVKGGTFVGANPAWGDEGCMLPTTPYYLRPWSYYQGALIEGQTFNENGIVLPAGYEITKGATADGRPTYTVTYNE